MFTNTIKIYLKKINFIIHKRTGVCAIPLLTSYVLTLVLWVYQQWDSFGFWGLSCGNYAHCTEVLWRCINVCLGNIIINVKFVYFHSHFMANTSEFKGNTCLFLRPAKDFCVSRCICQTQSVPIEMFFLLFFLWDLQEHWDDDKMCKYKM